MISEKLEAAPGARELACDLLATYTGNDNIRTATSDNELEITSVELTGDCGKAHYITAYHAPAYAGFCLTIYGNGIYALTRPGPDGSYTEEIKTGHISETSAEPVVRAHTEKMVAALTGHQVKQEDHINVNDIYMGRFLKPCDSPDPEHSFYYEETGDGYFDIHLGDNPDSEPPFFNTLPFATGLVSDILRREIRYTCSLQITNPDLFCKSMQIDTLEEINEKVLLNHLFASDTIPGSEGSVVSYLAMENLDCEGLNIDNENNDIISMTVIACVEDHCAFVALARNEVQSAFDDRDDKNCKDWYPQSMSEALWATTIASNSNPAPADMGFEIYDTDVDESWMTLSVDLDEEMSGP